MFADLIRACPWPDKTGSRTAVGPFHGSAESLCVAELARQHEILLVITPDTGSALALERELPLFLGDEVPLWALPDWETLPYDSFSPHQDIVSERLRTLYQLPGMSRGVLIISLPTLMHRLAPEQHVVGASLLLETGTTLALQPFLRRLERSGYRAVETVREHGEFALRGSLLDIYPMGSNIPYRVDLLDDEIDSLRGFDPETQRTIGKVERIELLPAREFSLTDSAIRTFQHQWHEAFNVDHDACPVYADVSAGRAPGGAEYYLPLFFEQTATLFDYLPDNTAIITTGDHHSAAQRFWREVTTRFEEYGIDPRRPLLPPHRLFLRVEELYRFLGKFAVLELRRDPEQTVHIRTSSAPPPELMASSSDRNATRELIRFRESHGGPVLLCAESAGRRELLLEALAEQSLHPPQVTDWEEFLASGHSFAITTAPVDRGLYCGTQAPTLVCEAQLFGARVAQRRRRRRDAATDSDQVFRHINELREGVPVVHLEHGVGRYIGLQNLTAGGQESEFLTLEYAGGSRLYVPVSSLGLITRYAGSDPELAPLHKLGSDQWTKARRKAGERATDVAAELLEIHARRAAREGTQFDLDRAAWERFTGGFPFEETPDQAQAIAAVVDDMCGPGIMDRLICGDVGFGKTEVAMRAAFIAVQNGLQVAVLVPTTLLAQQHYNSFVDRFADWPARIEAVSRFRSRREQEEILKRAAEGRVDILIGTHKLLQSGVDFSNLGLLIIDEEHRFGVKQKEKLKSLRAQVDILALTATPIPRTLNMALGGMRDISIIATPPARRLSIRTFVREHNVALIKEAVMRETLRGGQVYYLHNEVKTIDERARKLRELCPDLEIGVAHGQMRESELERVMSSFYHRRYHILLCTTIIETGIDIPNANTIIIERADKFGLAQLHQLRGRVGRSHHQAYAYLLTPPGSAVSADAGKRLDAIASASDLGAGYILATHDLEIRGAGELLGDEQSGQIQSVGFSLYMEMLKQAVAALQRGEIPDPGKPLNPETEVNLHLPALIPEDYLPDVNMRLILYRRIAAAAGDRELRDLKVEMIDRFGLLPPQVNNLFTVAGLRQRAEPLGLAGIEAGEHGGAIEFRENTPVQPLDLVNLVQSQPEIYQLTGGNRLRFKSDLADTQIRIAFVERLLQDLTPDAREDAA